MDVEQQEMIWCNEFYPYMDTNGTHLFISSEQYDIDVYDSNMVLDSTITVGTSESAYFGLGMNDTHIFRGDYNGLISLYHFNGTYNGTWLNISSYLRWGVLPNGITVSDDYVWILDQYGQEVVLFYINGTYIENLDPDDYNDLQTFKGLCNDESFLYISEGSHSDFARYYIGGYPSNFYIKIGGQAYNYTYNITGEFTTTNITTNLSSHFNDYLGDTAETGVINVPIYMSSDKYCGIDVNSINITYLYDFNPISLDTDLIQGIIDSSLTNDVNITIVISSETEGNITLTIDKYDYAGGNKTYTVLAHDDSYSTNQSYDITYYYSKFNVSINPSNIDYWDIGANVWSWEQTFIPPFGNENGDGNPFFNVQSLAYGTEGIDIYVRYNESIDSCATTWFEGKNQTTGNLFNVTLNTSAQILIDKFTTYEQNTNVSTWTNLSCSAENSTLILPYFCWFSLCDSCIKTSDWSDNCDWTE